jgi:radical SAM protein with 4Fe4S-binding SPASM domain
MSEPEVRQFSYQWHITDECNLQCSHCYRNDQRQSEMPFDEARSRVVDQIIAAAPKMKAYPIIALSGGEPLLYRNFFPLLDYLREKADQGNDFKVILVTNGTLLTSEVVSRLSTYTPMLSDIQISLDGGSAEVHDTIRGAGSFAKSLEGLQRIIDSTPLNTTISYTYHRGNAADIPNVLALGERLGVSILYITRLVPIGRGAELDKLFMEPDEIRDVLTLLHETSVRWRQEESQGQPRPLIAEDQTLFHLTDTAEAIRRQDQGHGGLGNSCAVAVATLTILADGTVLPCRRLPVPIGNLREQSLLEIWFGSDLLWQFRQRGRYVQGKCQDCEFLHKHPGLCAGGAACIAYGTSGDYHQCDPHCWYTPDRASWQDSHEDATTA